MIEYRKTTFARPSFGITFYRYSWRLEVWFGCHSYSIKFKK